MTTLFVTGSGTDIGKTAVCCRLLEELPDDVRVRCIKPVVTGFDPDDVARTDPARLLSAQGLADDAERIAATSPWRYRAALSADTAAAREGKALPFDDLVAFCREPRNVDLNLIEGIGGVMAPLDAKRTVLDWIAALASPVWLVAGSYLGSLSHALTALATLEGRAVTVAAIVISQSLDEPMPTAETAATLARFASERLADAIPIVVLPRQAPTEPILWPTLSEMIEKDLEKGV